MNGNSAYIFFGLFLIKSLKNMNDDIASEQKIASLISQLRHLTIQI